MGISLCKECYRKDKVMKRIMTNQFNQMTTRPCTKVGFVRPDFGFDTVIIANGQGKWDNFRRKRIC